MSKRDATQLEVEEEEEERGAKQPRCSEEAKDVTTAAAAASSASSSSASAMAVDLTTVKRARTLEFVNAMRGDGSIRERVRATCALLQMDSKRGESLLDMSMRVDGNKAGSVCALFQLLRLRAEATQRDWNEADHLFKEVAPLLPRLLRSFDPAITDPTTGNNALHELFSRLVAGCTSGFTYRSAEALIERGVDVDQRNAKGRTAALIVAKGLGPDRTDCTLRLLLLFGADVNAQDNAGDTLLHYLIHEDSPDVMQDLFDSEVSGLDLFVPNRAGHTPLELAAERQIKIELQVRVEKWHSHTRPAVLSALSEPLIPDQAKLVLGYVDGSGLPFAAPTTPNAEAE